MGLQAGYVGLQAWWRCWAHPGRQERRRGGGERGHVLEVAHLLEGGHRGVERLEVARRVRQHMLERHATGGDVVGETDGAALHQPQHGQRDEELAHLGHVEARVGAHGVRRVPRGVADGELGELRAGARVEHDELRAEQMAVGVAAGEQRAQRLRQARGGRVGGAARLEGGGGAHRHREAEDETCWPVGRAVHAHVAEAALAQQHRVALAAEDVEQR